jgi:hypothetical protein
VDWGALTVPDGVVGEADLLDAVAGRSPLLEEVVDLDDGARGGDDDEKVVAGAVQRDVGWIEIGEDERVGVVATSDSDGA